MKILISILLFFVSSSLLAQKNMPGLYRDYFGSRIELNADRTFEYDWHFDLSGSWTKGTWTYENDTVYFHMIPTYDTVSYKDKNGNSADKLILSVDKTPERMTTEQYTGMGLSSVQQNLQSYPDKLFFKKGRLYKIYDRRLVVKKQKGFWTHKKWNPWYFRSEK